MHPNKYTKLCYAESKSLRKKELLLLLVSRFDFDVDLRFEDLIRVCVKPHIHSQKEQMHSEANVQHVNFMSHFVFMQGGIPC